MSDDEWALVVPYLTLLPEAAGQRGHGLREVFLRYVLKTGAPWRWMAAGCFDTLADDLRAVLRLAADAPRSRVPRSWTAAPCGPAPSRRAGRT